MLQGIIKSSFHTFQNLVVLIISQSKSFAFIMNQSKHGRISFVLQGKMYPGTLTAPDIHCCFRYNSMHITRAVRTLGTCTGEPAVCRFSYQLKTAPTEKYCFKSRGKQSVKSLVQMKTCRLLA